MADNVSITPGTGDTVAADDIAGAKHQRIKVTLGADGVNDGDVSASNPMPVTGPLTDAQLRATPIPVSASTLPLASGASTSALQTSGNASISSIDTKTPALGQAVMAASSPVVIASDQSSVPISGPVTISGTPTVLLDASTLAALESTTVQNGAGASAVNIQDGGNSITVDATALPLPTGAATETTLGTLLADSTFTGRINTLGQKTMANSTPIVIASDQSQIAVTANEDSDTRQGVYFSTTGTFLVQAAADAATAGRAWLINPLASGRTVRIRRIRFASQLGSALVAVTSPRIVLQRVTFTGTASGATVAMAKRRTADATPVSSLRTASTGLTLTAGDTLYEFLPTASATAVAYSAPSITILDLERLEYIELAPGEGVVIRQPDAGTAADTRRCVMSFVIEEV